MLKEGMQVVVVYSNGDNLEGKLVNRARGAGDLWEIEDHKGCIHAINPYSAELEEIRENLAVCEQLPLPSKNK